MCMKHSIFGFFLLLIFVCSGCGNDRVNITLSGINYTDRHISDFSVDNYSGGSVSVDGGGGSFVCCVPIPAHWKSGAKVTVRWADNEKNGVQYKEKIVEVPEYNNSDLEFFIVHFFPNDEVKVLVTNKIITHPDYPYPKKRVR